MKTYNVENICGTIYTTDENCAIDNLMQVLMFGENNRQYIKHEQWDYYNVRSLVFAELRNNQVFLGIFPFSYSYDDKDNYCSYVTSEDDNITKSYEFIFDLTLHDAAVKATENAARYEGQLASAYARLACALWQYSRQLRQYTQGKQ